MIWLKYFNPFRGPDFVIGDPDAPYMLRWHIIPRNRWFCIYLHNMLRDDEDRAPHDHPWASLSLCLKGKLIEHRPGHPPRTIGPGSIVYRGPEFGHRLEVPTSSWTIFVRGKVVREWGFHCEKGWRHWRDFTMPTSKGQIGRGCD